MASDGSFSAVTVEILGKRAALLCSNPDCGALTTGPAAEVRNSVNLGEAAHIYGRTNTSARFSSDLTTVELSDITNGIWLCRNCHKLVDNDPLRFPAELLFQWRRQHEQAILDQLGKPGEKLREKLRIEHLRFFETASPLAQQIIIDRPDHWELKLTAEILRTGLGRTDKRWQQLKRGMYSRKSTIVPIDEIGQWLSVKVNDASNFIQALPPLFEALNEAQGALGQPGDEKDIFEVCRLIEASAQNLLEWEEDMRFSYVPEEFREVLKAMQGIAGHQLRELLRIPSEIARILALENPTGTHRLSLVFDVPANFQDSFHAALDCAIQRFQERT